VRVLYGVCGEGMGHAVRSAVAARHLVQRGHDLTVLAGSRPAAAYLQAQLGSNAVVVQTLGAQAVYDDNAVAVPQTLLANLLRAGLAPAANAAASLQILATPPDVVVSDFDSLSAYMAARLDKPLVALDNIHFGNRCRHAPEVLRPEDDRAYQLFRMVADRAVPGARRYMVLAMHRPASMLPQTSLHLPLLRDEVLSARAGARADGPVVAYHNGHADHAGLLRAYCESGLPVRVYGVPGHAQTASGAVRCLSFHGQQFLADLARARFVVGGAGFTLLSEAMYLGKPVLAVPYGLQYEQLLNASYLERAGWGRRCERLSAHALRAFADHAPHMAEVLAEQAPRQTDNSECLDALAQEVERG
jgi:uncharacterized protein (TIGR00661 family)